MEILPSNRMEFMVLDEDIEIPSIKDLICIYKVGNVISYFEIPEDVEEGKNHAFVGKFEVVEVKHEIYDAIVGEQVVFITLKRI